MRVMAPRARRANDVWGKQAFMHADKLVMMTNQIAMFHRRQTLEVAAAEVAAHLRRFWEPRMRAAIHAHLDEGGEGLSEIARRAVEMSKAQESKASG